MASRIRLKYGCRRGNGLKICRCTGNERTDALPEYTPLHSAAESQLQGMALPEHNCTTQSQKVSCKAWPYRKKNVSLHSVRGRAGESARKRLQYP